MVPVVFKPTSGADKFTIELETSSTVLQAKEEVKKHLNYEVSEQRLIFKGQVLKDERTLDSYGVEANSVVHVVKGRSASATPASAGQASTAAPRQAAAATTAAPSAFPSPLGDALPMGDMSALMGDPAQASAMMSQMANNPVMQAMLSNPELMRTMLQSNPVVRDLMDRHPDIAQMLSDPAVLRESLQLAANPSLMREQMRNADRAMSNIESLPEGFNMLRNLYETFQEPLMNATAMQDPAAARSGATSATTASTNTSTDASQPSTQSNTGPGGPNAAPLNPWAAAQNAGGAGGAAGAAGMPSASDLAAMLGGIGMPGAGGGAAGGAAGAPGAAGLAGMMGSPMGMPDFAGMSAMMQQPGMMEMMQQLAQQPGFLDTIASTDPTMRAMMNANPQMRTVLQQTLSNPDLMRSLLNPNTMQTMMQLQQSLRQPGAAGSFLPPPQSAAPAEGQAAGGAAPDLSALMSSLMGGMGGAGGAFPGMGSFGMPQPTPVANPETTYASQLQQLADMGFTNQESNIAALQATHGNVHAAVEYLLSHM